MAGRSFLGDIGRRSIEPTMQNFTGFVDKAVMKPETLARNKQEQYQYHTAQNLDLADQGLIDRSAVPFKSYVDAGQAKDMQEGLMMDSLNRGLLAKPFVEEVTATGTFDPYKKFSRKYTDKQGNVRTVTEQRRAKQTDVADESLGGLPSQFRGFETETTDEITKAFVPKKAKASGKGYTGGTGWNPTAAKGSYDTYGALQKKALASVLQQKGIFTDDKSRNDKIMSLIVGLESSTDVDKAFAQLEEYGVDANSAIGVANAMKDVDAQFANSEVYTADGTRNVPTRATGRTKELTWFDAKSGGKVSGPDLTEHIDKSDGLMYEVNTSGNETILMSWSQIEKFKEQIRANKNSGKTYHIDTTSGNKLIEVVPRDVKKAKPFLDKNGKKTSAFSIYEASLRDTKTFNEAKAMDDELTATLDARVLAELQTNYKGKSDPTSFFEDEIEDWSKEFVDKARASVINSMGKHTKDADGNVQFVGNQVKTFADARTGKLKKVYDINRNKLLEGAINANISAKMVGGEALTSRVNATATPEGLQITFGLEGQTPSAPVTLPLDLNPDDLRAELGAHYAKYLRDQNFDVTAVSVDDRVINLKNGGK